MIDAAIDNARMERFLDNAGTRLWSSCHGQGTPLILCNGGPGCDDYLEPVATMIDDLCRVVRFEPRGTGRSDWDKRYDLDTTISDIDFVRHAYGFEKVIIAGHSAGVDLALTYAIRHPDRVLGVLGLSGGRVVNDREWSRIYHENRDRRGEDNGGKTFHADPDLNRVGNASWRQFITQPTLLRDLSQIPAPAVFINAGNDIRPNWPTMQLAHLLPRARYVEIPGAGHNLWLSHPTELRTQLRHAIQKTLAT